MSSLVDVRAVSRAKVVMGGRPRRARIGLLVTLVAAAWALTGATSAFGQVRATMEWNTTADIDLHVWDPDGNVAFFGAPAGIPRATLSSDLTTGPGSETFTDDDVPSTRAFTYGVCHFSGTEATNVTLTVTDPDGTQRTLTAVLNPGEQRLMGSSPDGAGFVPTGTFCSGAPPPTAGSADLSLAEAVSDPSPAVGDAVTWSYTVSNAGPDAATGVVLSVQLPEGLAFSSADPRCSSADGTFVICTVASIPAGETPPPFQVHTQATRAGALAPTSATVGADQADPAPASNQTFQGLTVRDAAAAAAGPPQQATPPPPPPSAPPSPPAFPPAPAPGRGAPVPAPVLGKTATVTPVSGRIRVKVNGVWKTLAAGETIPLGATVDARNGVVSITSAADASGTTQTANFGAGVFVLRQTTGAAPTTELVLTGGSFRSCSAAAGAASRKARAGAAQSRKKPKKRSRQSEVKRELWGDGKGRFRTVGRYGAATVRGTRWTTQDRCDGTNVRVTQGRVSVLDRPRNTTVTVTAGRSYLARAPRARSARRG